ncbi:MAG: type II toxin-antitoxin system RelE/ParE family toxin [Acidobacteria bacterium]|nr:type II toxin-antitoxin system RelE/ParE family toxin [Acidobacteriota bacterium]
MAYEVRYSKESLEHLKKLRAHDRAEIIGRIKRFLTTNPTRTSKARIKRLRQPAPTEYRLRVKDFRVYYDVDQQVIYIVQVLSKEDSISYLLEDTGEQ